MISSRNNVPITHNKVQGVREEKKLNYFYFQECQVEDSGTESDDETEKEDAEDADSEGGDCSKLDNNSNRNISFLVEGRLVHQTQGNFTVYVKVF